MPRNKRRFAGEMLLAEPHAATEITNPRYLDKEQAARQDFGDNRMDYAKRNVHDWFRQNDRSVTMMATAEPFGYRMQVDRYPGEMGSKSTVEMIREANPELQYDLSFSVDGKFEEDTANPMSRRDAVSLAREVDRRFDKLIPKLQENSIVYNTPVGAKEGNYERADLYMRKGFGPVQIDGAQYGIIKDGQIVPISPLKPDDNYALHRADRSLRRGDQELSEQMLAGVIRRNPDSSAGDMSPELLALRQAAISQAVNRRPSMPLPVMAEAVDPRQLTAWQEADSDTWTRLREQSQTPQQTATRQVYRPQRTELQQNTNSRGSAWGAAAPAVAPVARRRPAPPVRRIQQSQSTQQSSADAAIRAQRRRRLAGMDPTRSGSIYYPSGNPDPNMPF